MMSNTLRFVSMSKRKCLRRIFFFWSVYDGWAGRINFFLLEKNINIKLYCFFFFFLSLKFVGLFEIFNKF